MNIHLFQTLIVHSKGEKGLFLRDFVLRNLVVVEALELRVGICLLNIRRPSIAISDRRLALVRPPPR